MPLRLLLDENLTGTLKNGIERAARREGVFIDVVCVGEPTDLPQGTRDPQLLIWAERENRVLLSHDSNTLPRHLADHLATGHTSPGIILLPRTIRFGDLIQLIVIVAHASEPDEWEGRGDWLG